MLGAGECAFAAIPMLRWALFAVLTLLVSVLSRRSGSFSELLAFLEPLPKRLWLQLAIDRRDGSSEIP